MTEIQESNLTFSFPNDCEVGKYDEWSFYRKQFQSTAGGSKAVDILCIAGNVAWLIEVKDYRCYEYENDIDLFYDQVAKKIRDTLADLAAASANANNKCERYIAQRALAVRQWRVVLHLEQPIQASRLRPQPFDPATVMLNLRRKGKLGAIDTDLLVLDCRSSQDHGIPWTAK